MHVLVLVQSILFQHLRYIHVHGAVAWMVNAMVAFSSSVGGSGMLQFPNRLLQIVVITIIKNI